MIAKYSNCKINPDLPKHLLQKVPEKAFIRVQILLKSGEPKLFKCPTQEFFTESTTMPLISSSTQRSTDINSSFIFKQLGTHVYSVQRQEALPGYQALRRREAET